MNARSARYSLIALATVSLFAAHPALSSAQDTQAQIQSILARLAELSALVKGMEQSASVCPSLTRVVSVGSRGDDVKGLQEFLIREGLLSAESATGYFGPLTEAAVKQWQAKQNIVSSGDALSTGFGVVGPKTRTSILARCAVLSAAPVSTTPGIFILAPRENTRVAGGNELRIAWQSANVPPQSTVALSLFDSAGKRVGSILNRGASSGEYSWRVPSGSTECAPGEDAFSCIVKLAGCDGDAICSLSSGTYSILATLSNGLSTTSPPFQVMGGSFSSLLSLIGKPVPTSSLGALLGDPATTTPAPGSCVHDGAVFAPGATLSVECDGNCPSPSPGSGTGFITGACMGGEWCVPFTPYCAESFDDINLSAYEGGGAGSIGSGYAINCPVEGYKAYLSCPYGGCETGWNTCRSSKWVRDEKQSVVEPGTRGPCQSTELWCEVGSEHGFSCVPSWQCINGKASVGEDDDE